MTNLEAEAEWLNNTYKELYGIFPHPRIKKGVPNAHVAAIQNAIFRWHITKMREIIDEYDIQRT